MIFIKPDTESGNVRSVFFKAQVTDGMAPKKHVFVLHRGGYKDGTSIGSVMEKDLGVGVKDLERGTLFEAIVWASLEAASAFCVKDMTNLFGKWIREGLSHELSLVFGTLSNHLFFVCGKCLF
jgi:hypothetical protein